MSIALAIHLLSAVIWVGGMFFAYVCLRPVAASQLEPPMRLPLWHQVFVRFFRWVWGAVLALLVTGHAMIGWYGGFGAVGKHVHVMLLLGYVMFALYAFLYFMPFQRMSRAVGAQDWPAAGAELNRIRQIVATNLVLGLVVVVIASGGKGWL